MINKYTPVDQDVNKVDLNTFLKEASKPTEAAAQAKSDGQDSSNKGKQGNPNGGSDPADSEKKTFEFKIDDDLGDEPEAIVHAEAVSDDEEESEQAESQSPKENDEGSAGATNSN